MNTQTTATPGATPTKPDIDRGAIALRVFDEVICAQNFDLCDGLDDWLSIIHGIAGYLEMTADPAPGNPHQLDLNAYSKEISTLGTAIVKAAGIARILAEEVARPARKARADERNAFYDMARPA